MNIKPLAWVAGMSCLFTVSPLSAAEATGLRFSGYGDMVFSYADFGLDPKASPRGAKRDQRLTFDTKRFVLELESELPRGFEFEAELEFEHGGTGAALELEYEEGGEYEVEVEKAGEIQFEKLALTKNWEASHLRIGRMPVAFGTLPMRHEPLDYLGTIRPESEERFLPAAWNEIGLEYRAKAVGQEFWVQLINGLDSSGFSSPYWISQGHQSRFETIKATDPALVLRWSNAQIAGVDTGFSVYYGDSSRNRPQPDLIKRCAANNNPADTNSVAPCGYEHTPLTMVSWHAQAQWGRLRSSQSILWGKLEHPKAINDRNSALSQKYPGILRSAVAREAFAAWTEWGYMLPGFEAADSWSPFIRLDLSDTVWKTAPGQIDQPRFDRRVLTLGASYFIEKSIYFKGDVSQRRFGSKDLRTENETRVAVGFIY